MPNYLSARIPVAHGLNIEAWDKYSDLFNDPLLVPLITYGFPLGYTANCIPTPAMRNHTSATDHPQHVDNYIQTELAHGALSGPYQHPPFIPWCMTSAIMTAEKKNSVKRRVILDLSYPAGTSVNDGIPGDVYLGQPYKLHLPSVLDLRDEIVRQGEGSFLWSRDIERAFRQLRIDPLDYPLMCLYWKDSYYIDLAPAFGLRHASMYFQRATNAIVKILLHEGHIAFNYIDDLAGVHASFTSATAAFNRAHTLLQELGLTESTAKATAPSTHMTWLGVDICTISMTLKIPTAKIEECLTLASKWRHLNHCTKSQLRKFLGKLFHVATCNSTLRLFVNRLLDTLRMCPDHGYVGLSDEFQADISWICEFLPTYNGIDMITPNPTAAHPVVVDSCLTGAGGHFGMQWYCTVFPREIVDSDRHISDLEFLNIVVAIRLFLPGLCGTTVHIQCDNAAAVSVLNTGRGRSSFLLRCAREIWKLTAAHDIRIICSHIAGIHNTLADKLSRAHMSHAAMDELLCAAADCGATLMDVDEDLFKLSTV